MFHKIRARLPTKASLHYHATIGFIVLFFLTLIGLTCHTIVRDHKREMREWDRKAQFFHDHCEPTRISREETCYRCAGETVERCPDFPMTHPPVFPAEELRL